jgi:Icc-related predicted phosphoesterase
VPALPLPANIVVIGDFGSATTSEYQVADSIIELAEVLPLTAFVTTGDNFYSDDIKDIWLAPYGWLEGTDIEILASWGNHDIETETRQRLVTEYLRAPGRAYSVSFGSVLLIVLDSNQVGNESQTRWLEAELEASSGLSIVVFHHPAFSCGYHGTTEAVVESWVPLFEEHRVDLVLNGHDHDYQRFERAGVTYVVTGGGGRALRPLRQCPTGTPEPLASTDQHHHFVVLNLSEDGISGRTLSADGTEIDAFVIDG